MKVAVNCLVLLLAVACMANDCPANFCDSVNCSEGLTAENCDGSLIPHTSECGCCPTCYKTMPMFGECDEKFGPNSIHTVRRVCQGLGACINGRCHPLPM